jgi:uncharacterized protein with von Willebrand factor type A (vWA) domain
MRYRYTEWDGTEFPTQDHLSFFDQFMDFVLEYGDRAMDALERMEMNESQRELLEQLIKDGLLEKAGARWKLTPRAVNAMQRKALMEIFKNLQSGTRDGHEAIDAGRRGERIEGTVRYQFGDPVSEIDLSATLRNTLARSGPGLPIKISEDDFELFRAETTASSSLVILLDMSGSMQRYNRFVQAKKCAMALTALVRQRFPLDTVDLVGFFSTSEQIPEHKLPLLMPKPVTIFDYEVKMQVPLSQASAAPQHFTNLQMGLMSARRILRRRGGDNKQIFIITDGQPTAHVQGDMLYLLYPPEKRTTIATLQEAVLAKQEGIRIASFALIEDYYYMDWVGFIDQLTKLTKGVAFYCTSSDLSSAIMESYLSGKKQKSYLS